MLEQIRSRIARWISPSKIQRRQYGSARNSRLTADWRPANSSADAELVSSLTTLRSRSRQLGRDFGYAKRGKVVVVNNVIGCGIGMQAHVKTSRDELNVRVNDDIEATFEEWSEAQNCHTGGRLAFKHLERVGMGQVFDAGEVFFREHYRSFGPQGIPYALELIEAERIADDLASTNVRLAPGHQIRMGVEVDEFQKPVAYWIRKNHPGEVRWKGEQIDEIERVPAEQIIHLAYIDRWPQTRGEPWMHAAARRLNDMDGYSEAEIIRARAQASLGGVIETSEDAESFGELQDDGSTEMELEPGVLKRTNPGEKVHLPAPTAPNAAADPFLRALLREVAAAIGVSYESISRDYSQSNYSSSRMGLIEDRDLWKMIQAWFICDFRYIVHKRWLRQAVLAGKLSTISVEAYALSTRKFEAVKFKPRGWTWVDPTVEVEAYKEAVKSGFTTVGDVIAATADGRDIEDVMNERERELKMMASKGLVFETSPEFYDKEDPPPKPANVAGNEQNPPPRRVFSFGSKQ